MRTRTRHIVARSLPGITGYTLTGAQTNHYCSGAPDDHQDLTISSTPLQEVDWTDEIMADSLGRDKSHGVTHRKRRCVINTQEVLHGGTVNAGQWVTYPFPVVTLVPGRKALCDVIAFNTTVGPYNPPTRWTISGSVNESVLKENCFEKARGLKADVLLNIVEGHQLWPAITSLATTLPYLGYHWGNIRKLIKTASGGYLAWKFGVSPVLQDIMAINRYLPKLKEDLRKHSKGDLQRSSSTATQVMNFNNADSNVTVTNGFTTNAVRYTGKCPDGAVTRYVLVVRPKIKYETRLFQALDLAMSRFATSPASLAWEKVPFSFIVDWFVDLRGVCRALDSSLGFAPYEVKSFTRSYSYRTETAVSYNRSNPCNGSNIFDLLQGTVECRHYVRSLASPTATWPTWKPRFGKNQAGITAALIGQMLTKSKLPRND